MPALCLCVGVYAVVDVKDVENDPENLEFVALSLADDSLRN